jgi:hypothetical protein
MTRKPIAATLAALAASTILAAGVMVAPPLNTPTQAASVDHTMTLRRAGYWTAWYDPSNQDGDPMCGMRTMIDHPGGATGAFFVKYVPGGDIFFQVFESNWRIPNGTTIPVSLIFDRGTPWTATARGLTSGEGNSSVG